MNWRWILCLAELSLVLFFYQYGFSTTHCSHPNTLIPVADVSPAVLGLEEDWSESRCGGGIHSKCGGDLRSPQEQWPVVTWPAWRCAGWEGRRCCVEWWWLTGNTLTLTRGGGGGGVFIASNMFCQGCFVATGSHCLCTDTLPSLQDFTFFSAPLLCPRVCTWKVSYLWKTCTFVSPFLYFPYISWQWSLNKSSVWSLCLCVRLRTQTPERSERGVSRQSAIESNDASVSAIAPLGNQLAGFSPGLK